MDPQAERSATPTPRPLDAVALARVQRRLQAAAAPPWLHGEVARRMALRLPIIKREPERIVDWGSFVGAGTTLLRQQYPRARLLAVEADEPRRRATAAALARPWWSPQRWAAASSAITADAVPPAQAQLLWSNMALHGAGDPQAVMMQWQRALQVDGFLMFSTLGPGSLRSLAALYAAQGWPAPFAPFVDMHDLGDMLVHAGFAEPVMDQETVTLTWPGAEALLAELRGLGGNVARTRTAGLRTPRWRARLLGLLQAQAGADGRIALDFELVYGHAFKGAPRHPLAPQTTLPLDDLRAMVRAPRRRA